MKLSNYRAAQSGILPVKYRRILPQMCSRNSPISRTMHRNHRESEQTHRVPDQM